MTSTADPGQRRTDQRPDQSHGDPRASVPRVDRHRPKGPAVRPSKSGRRRAVVLIAVHVLVGLHFLHWWLTGRSMTPLEPSESMQTIEAGRLNAGFLLFTGLIATTLILGRWFCGWACHIVALQDLCAFLLGRFGLRPRPVRSRLLVFAPWVVAGYMFFWPVLQHWLDPVAKPMPAVSDWELHLTTDELWVTFPGWIMAIATFLVVGFLIVWWLGAKGFCTYGCPYGAFFAVADRVAPMRIRVTDACEHCGHCTSVCTSNVRVHEEVGKYGQVVDPGCMKCLDCVSVCPKDALYFGGSKPTPFVVSQQRQQARADFSWAEEVLLAVVAIVAVQFVFRDAWFFEGVPLLLSVGLGVITAVFAVLLLRLVRRPDLTFQHTPLKVGGRFTRAGWLALVLVGGWLLLTAHTFGSQRYRLAAVAQVEELAGEATLAPQKLEEALAAADRALAWDLIDDPRVLERKGLVLHALGRHAESEAALLDALAARGRLDIGEANLALAGYSMDPQRRRFDQAAELLDAVLRQFPDHQRAQAMKAHLERVR